jgi:hypothetical protein
LAQLRGLPSRNVGSIPLQRQKDCRSEGFCCMAAARTALTFSSSNRAGLSVRPVGAWSLPKGEQHAGEDAEAAARRELKEELGVEALGPPQPLGRIIHFPRLNAPDGSRSPSPERRFWLACEHFWVVWKRCGRPPMVDLPQAVPCRGGFNAAIDGGSHG